MLYIFFIFVKTVKNILMIKYLLNLIRSLIFKNPIKISFLIASITTFHFAGSFQNSTKKIEVLSQVKRGSEHVYTVVNKETSDGYDVFVSDKEERIIDGCLIDEDYNDLNVLFWILFGILTIIFVVTTFIGMINDDDDISWEFEDAWKEAFSTLIYCEEENGEFYYFALGRLISKTDRQIGRNYRITHELRIDGFRDLYRCPKYQTKTQRRETLLNKIGIN